MKGTGLHRWLIAVAVALVFEGSLRAGEVPTPDEFVSVREYIKQALEDGIAPSVAV